jgi:hypothetical protein
MYSQNKEIPQMFCHSRNIDLFPSVRVADAFVNSATFLASRAELSKNNRFPGAQCASKAGIAQANTDQR